MNKEIIIAGPCAAESRAQVLIMANILKKLTPRKTSKNVSLIAMRASLWKPRTRPGFDGVGREGIPWLAEATKLGITVGTEVLLPDQVREVVKGIINNKGNPEALILWLGARNQNHLLQREIAKTMLGETPEEVKLMIKNQPWRDRAHWLGIIEHVTSTGFPRDRIILCHRGFSPGWSDNQGGLRNLPDWDMTMKVKKATGLPMIIDPSHIGGSAENVIRIVKEAKQYPFDGLIVEVHPDPINAKTDANQQLSISQLGELLKTI